MRTLLLPLLLLTLTSCLGQTPPSDKATDDSPVVTDDSEPPELCTFYTDADADGFGDGATATEAPCDAPPAGSATEAGDCDDAQPAAYPGADEVCDGVDNNCDGVTDDDAIDRGAWYADTDADGFGDPDAEVVACAAPEGHVADASDCDDRLAVINPDADEVCDGLDNDCDGAVDDETAIDRFSWTEDADSDGYGDDATLTLSCTAPGASWTQQGGDCNDDDPNVRPGQTSFYSTAHSAGGFDYNCDAQEEPEYPDVGECNLTVFQGVPSCSLTEGFEGSVPACGARADRVRDCNTSCVEVMSTNVVQRCR